MYYKWLDKWDERQSELGLEGKRAREFEVGGEFAFPSHTEPEDLADLIKLSERACSDEDYYAVIRESAPEVELESNFVRFVSDEITDVEVNNRASARLTDSGTRRHAVVVFHHWGAEQRNDVLARILAKFGMTVVELALPYHLERGRSPSDTDLFVSANLGRTIQSLRQGVLDGQRVVQFLGGQHYENISVLGTSLGSWVAALVAAHTDSVSKAALVLSGGSAADVVWTGRATRLVRESLETNVTLEQLRRAWCTLDLNHYADKLSRPDLQIQFVLAQRDQVIRPEISEEFVSRLRDANANIGIRHVNCGHRSLGRFPHNLFALQAMLSFLRR